MIEELTAREEHVVDTLVEQALRDLWDDGSLHDIREEAEAYIQDNPREILDVLITGNAAKINSLVLRLRQLDVEVEKDTSRGLNLYDHYAREVSGK